MTDTVEHWLAGLRVPGEPDELEAKALLSACGIAVPRGIRLPASDALADPGLRFPLVVKVCTPRLLHKTEAHAVELGVEADRLASAVDRLRARFAGCDLLLEEQIAFDPPECIAGALWDRDFGPAVMVGAGGVLAEVYGDVAFRLAPCPASEARAMLDELRLAPVFAGVRGSRLDGDALAAVIARLADLAGHLGARFSQLDVNPIVYAGQEWVALDAALILAPPAPRNLADASHTA